MVSIARLWIVVNMDLYNRDTYTLSLPWIENPDAMGALIRWKPICIGVYI